MAILSIRNASLGFGGPLLLDQINLQLASGERVCLMGRNGEGKTTLLNIIRGTVLPDEGEIYRQPGVQIAALSQEIPTDIKGRVFEVIAGGMKKDPCYPLPGDLFHESEDRGQGDPERHLPVKMKKILTQLKLDPDVEFRDLSTGLKRRVLLARAVVDLSDILLLDEPTNHMDIESIGLIEAFLLKYPGTIIFVTHDRVFLQRMATRIIEIDRSKVISWSCNYETYLVRKAELLETETDQNIQFDKKLAKEEQWLRKGLRARRTRNEGRVRVLLKMREARDKRRRLTGNANMQLQEAERSGRLVIDAKQVSYGYDNNKIIQNFSVMVMRGDRIGIIGPNGAGKTTLLRLLLNEIVAAEGTVRHGTNLEIAYFDQEREQLNEEKTLLDNIAHGNEMITINGKGRHVINYLKDFLFLPDRARSPVKTLSGGERNRLLLARLFAKQSNVIVMDEPTNDLDIETLELLEELLLEYQGTVLLVSHDRAFLNNVVTSTLVFEAGGLVNEYVGGYDDWLCQRKQPLLPKKQIKPLQTKTRPVSDEKKRKLSFHEQRELAVVPERIEAMEKEQEELFAAMADPEFYRTQGDKVAAAREKLEELGHLLAQAYMRWEELESRANLKS